MQIFQGIAAVFLSYVIGSIPFGLLLGKVFARVDIREFGSKNIGATNATRILGKKLGFFTKASVGFLSKK